EILQIQPAVYGGECSVRQWLEERKVQQIRMKVQDVELTGPRAHLIEHAEVRGHVRLQCGRIEAQRLVAYRGQRRSCLRALAREQRDRVSEGDELVTEI